MWVLAVYRPPSYRDQENALLSRVVCKFCEGREVVVLGDFKLPSIVWIEERGMLNGIKMFIE